MSFARIPSTQHPKAAFVPMLLILSNTNLSYSARWKANELVAAKHLKVAQSRTYQYNAMLATFDGRIGYQAC